jgi:hypothetical protein
LLDGSDGDSELLEACGVVVGQHAEVKNLLDDFGLETVARSVAEIKRKITAEKNFQFTTLKVIQA